MSTKTSDLNELSFEELESAFESAFESAAESSVQDAAPDILALGAELEARRPGYMDDDYDPDDWNEEPAPPAADYCRADARRDLAAVLATEVEQGNLTDQQRHYILEAFKARLSSQDED